MEFKIRDKIANGEIKIQTFIKTYLKEYVKIKRNKPTEINPLINPSMENKLNSSFPTDIIEFSLSIREEKQMGVFNKFSPRFRMAEDKSETK